ncbi:hypothetical protein NDI37_15700 [Funiculus sociatus GB2-A5]|jgi:hypothetical protein|uniref:Uncharacterized protein n=1 Tax=Funiculus sociatus GB2-A5 TaxID=2933946 RepID=A0ABV0JTA2_9CYAN|nr:MULTISPECIES: hypothetical protein [unclassified Trichocoleus]MBD1907710.1 hypothetical protein [Trichocoleus sp. FACHB-832]MBD2061305.1 hypothetical protein [Trichocoleus sp. FACHB-6]
MNQAMEMNKNGICLNIGCWIDVAEGLGNTGSRITIKERLKELFSNSRHQWMWDEPSLTEASIKHGFKNIRRCEYGDWSNPIGTVGRKDRHGDAICIEVTK